MSVNIKKYSFNNYILNCSLNVLNVRTGLFYNH